MGVRRLTPPPRTTSLHGPHDFGCWAAERDPLGRIPYAIAVPHGQSVGDRDFSKYMMGADGDAPQLIFPLSWGT